MYAFLKSVHLSCVVVTIAGFLLRGYWSLTGAKRLKRKVIRIAPHVIDAVLLASGVALIVELGPAVMRQDWLFAKIAGIVVYILLGLVALRFARTQGTRMVSYVAAVAAFAYVAGTAITKSPASWLAYLTS